MKNLTVMAWTIATAAVVTIFTWWAWAPAWLAMLYWALASTWASLALLMSWAPFEGPVSGVRIILSNEWKFIFPIGMGLNII